MMTRMNWCRLAFQVITIADILTGDSVQVTKAAQSIHCIDHPSSLWDWLNECPCNIDIRHWKDGLK
jgi:hypothetical protein